MFYVKHNSKSEEILSLDRDFNTIKIHYFYNQNGNERIVFI